MANTTSTEVSVVSVTETTGYVTTTTTYKAESSPVENFTTYDSPTDASYYPGLLNTGPDGKPIITPDSTESDYLKSSITTAHNMGVPHASEIGPIYTDPDFPESIAQPQGFDKDNPTLIKDRTVLLSKLIEKASKDEDYDPSEIVKLNHPLDPKSFFPDLNPFSLIGDPRWSLGAALQAMYQKFLPEVNSFLQSVSPSATTVDVNGNPCDADGNPITTDQMNMNAVSFDAEGVITYNYNSIEGLPKPPTAASMKKFFIETKDAAFKKHADAFVTYLKRNYLNAPQNIIASYPPRTLVALPWTVELIYLEFAGFFLIKLIQEVVKKIPPMEVVIVSATDLFQLRSKYKPEDIIGEAPSLGITQNFAGGTLQQQKSYMVYQYMYGYIELDGPEYKKSVYNPYGWPDRVDPDAPAPPAKPAVYETINGQRGRMITPALPEGRPGKLVTHDVILECKRYYPDQKDYISQELGLEIKLANNIIADKKHIQGLSSLSSPIPDYTAMI